MFSDLQDAGAIMLPTIQPTNFRKSNQKDIIWGIVEANISYKKIFKT